MDASADEINLFLPLAFGLIIFFLLSIGMLIYWFLSRFKVIEISDGHHLLGVLKNAVLSILGVFVIMAAIGVVGFVLNVVISFFKRGI